MPVIMGVFQNPILTLSNSGIKSGNDLGITQNEANQETKIEAEKSVRISCGKASILLSQDGRVEIRGTAIVQHSTGLNRIRGASVKLN